MTRLGLLLISGCALLLPATIAISQTVPAPAPGVAAPAKAVPPAAGDASAKSAKSKECSAQADQKGLHGKARKKFRQACKKG
jgi:CelD/BcsL family acetyltransferase involved in cellulose biosynthesis